MRTRTFRIYSREAQSGVMWSSRKTTLSSYLAPTKTVRGEGGVKVSESKNRENVNNGVFSELKHISSLDIHRIWLNYHHLHCLSMFQLRRSDELSLKYDDFSRLSYCILNLRCYEKQHSSVADHLHTSLPYVNVSFVKVHRPHLDHNKFSVDEDLSRIDVPYFFDTKVLCNTFHDRTNLLY